jgi:hypothetical protein
MTSYHQKASPVDQDEKEIIKIQIFEISKENLST